MSETNWQLKYPVSTVIFDCDGTISTIEGIDVLAEHNNVAIEVSDLTADAMGKSGMSCELYEKRLALVKPTQEQVIALGKEYYANRVQDVYEVFQILKRMNKTIYVVSAGLYPAVAILGELMGIAANNIFAVDIKFNAHGQYLDFDRVSPLVNRNGKRIVVSKLNKPNIYIGDGLNDLEVQDLVTRFVGYGGKFYRENIAARCRFYIKTISMAALLVLTLTNDEYHLLNAAEKMIYDKGMAAIEDDKVIIR